MQLTVVLLDLDCISLYLVVEDHFKCLVLLLQVEADLWTEVFRAKVPLSELLDS